MAFGQIDLYQGALLLLKETPLASLTEAREPRFLLDQIWNEGNGGGSEIINACLSEGEWVFARRTVQLVYDPNIQSNFGNYYASEIPSDYIRLSQLSADPNFMSPLNQYNEEQGYFFSPFQNIWLRYVSNDPAYGGNMNAWHPTFKSFVKAYMAEKICGKVTGSKVSPQDMVKEKARCLGDALGKQAIERPAQFPYRGTFVQARFGARGFFNPTLGN